jgi:phosphomannomutase/phosphoglucomutase
MGCKVITINGIMDGTFPGRLPEPSVDGLRNLSELVKNSGAAFGVAHDGDADRAVFIDDKGEFVEENQEFALITRHICHDKQGIIVTPVSTGQIVEIIARQQNCCLEYTPVGSIYVARTMRRLIEQGKTVVFGGEGNGGLIFPEHQFCRDGGMTAAVMVKVLKSTGKSLSDIVHDLPKRYIIKDKIAIKNGRQLLKSIKASYSQDTIDETDGIKIFRGDMWALIRASGTEPIVRFIIDSDEKDKGIHFHAELKMCIEDFIQKQKSLS